MGSHKGHALLCSRQEARLQQEGHLPDDIPSDLLGSAGRPQLGAVLHVHPPDCPQAG